MTAKDTKILGDGCSFPDGVAANWWLRAPNPGNANNPRNVNTSGQVNNNNAYNANGLTPDCEISQLKVSEKSRKSVPSRKEPPSRSLDNEDKITYTDGGISRDEPPISSVLLEVSNFDNLYRAAYECKRNVMWKPSTSGYIKNILMNTCKLRDELLTGTYKLSPYSIFEVHEKKTRTIVATKMRDRVVQRSLCNCYLYEAITKGFIYDNCACQIGKGTDFARERLKLHLRRFYRKNGMNGYVLQMDIHNFFGSTPHKVAKEAVDKRVKDEWARNHVYMIIDSFDIDGTATGLGLGSQITQLIELAVLDDLDHYIKERLRIKGYVRYNDDLILIHNDKEYLKECMKDIINKLNSLGLEVNEKKTHINRIDKGIHFLGFSFRLKNTGRVLMRILPKSVRKEKRKLKRQAKKVVEGEMKRDQLDACYQSFRNHLSKGSNKREIKMMDQYFAKIKEGVNNV